MNNNIQILQKKISLSHKKNHYKTIVFFNTYFDKGHIKDLVSWFLNEYGGKRTITFLESLKNIGFQKATQAGISLGLEDLEIPPEKKVLITEALIASQKIQQNNISGLLTSVEKSQCLIDTWNQTSDLLRQNAIQHFRSQNHLNPVYMMAFSGARGNISQVRQLVAMRGLMADPQGAILEFPIQSNFREGLTITEYLISCYGARKGLVDTALRTATSGYLTRRLVDSAQNAVISMIDCGTQRNIILEGKNLENRLIGRVLNDNLVHTNHQLFIRNHIISKNDAKLISQYHTQVLIRSPLTCEATTSVCQFCYGSNLASGKLVEIGEAVGVIAAQSIGEPGTQLTMRTFHTGGVGVFSDQALKMIISPYKGKIVFSDSIPGHFIRTPHGKIVYMIKYTPTDPNRILLKIEPFESVYKTFILREQDLPPGSLLFTKNGEVVTAKQLIVQASHLKLTKQKLPESSHPVYSPLEGQIFFESISLAIEKEVSFEVESLKTKTDSIQSNSKYGNISLISGVNSGLPDTRRMAKIGSFWVFASFNQHEIHTSSCFIEPGDLVSLDTILFNYKFYSPFVTQIHRIKSKLIFGFNTIQIPIRKISFRSNIYKTKVSNGDVLLYQKYNNHTAFAFWSLTDPYNKTLQEKFLYNHSSFLYSQIQAHSNINDEQFNVRLPKGSLFAISNLNVDFQLQINKNTELAKSISTNFAQNKRLPLSVSSFLSTALQISQNENFLRERLVSLDCINKLPNNSWMFISNKIVLSKSFKIVQPQFYPTGLVLDNISIPKLNGSCQIRHSFNFRKNKLLYVSETNYDRNWYNINNLLDKNTEIRQILVPRKHLLVKTKQINNTLRPQNDTMGSLPTKSHLALGLIWYSANLSLSLSTQDFFKKTNNTYYSPPNIFIFCPIKEYLFPTKQLMKKRKSLIVGKLQIQNPRNSLFCKQKSTLGQLIKNIKIPVFKYNPINTRWVSSQNLICYQFISTKNSEYSNKYNQYKTLSNTFSRGLTVFQYQFITFKDIRNFFFRAYFNNWILPFDSFSSGNVKVQNKGEFRYKTLKTTGTFISILRNSDLVTLGKIDSFISGYNEIGNLVRMNQEVSEGFISRYTGQIIKKTSQSITVRTGIPILASARGIVHVFQNDLVKKNELIITLKSRRLQTEDIVQGIPKIEQLFEARESQAGEVLSDTVHIRLRNAFVRELELLKNAHWSYAVDKSFLEAQQFLVENIIDAYANQGVKISEKHVEVIVRQMTSRVRILDGGETGLLPGELVQHNWIRKFNKQIRDIGLREACYEPIVLGISKSVLQSDSFLLAASFQEVSRVLVKSALSKKRDFLRGLHENVIVGQLVPAGTGLITQLSNRSLSTNSFFIE